jgi:hypothetical protein
LVRWRQEIGNDLCLDRLIGIFDSLAHKCVCPCASSPRR